MADWRAIQTALAERGHNPGPVDGIPGRRTTAAVKAFQREAGLDPDGIVGPITMGQLFFIGEADEQEGGPHDLPELPWLVILADKMGWLETQDRTKRFLKSDGKTLGDPSKNPWCGDLVETVINNTTSDPVPRYPYLARNWLTFGNKVTGGVYGAVGIFSRPSAGPTAGHVGFLIGHKLGSNPAYRVRGGNQDDMISDTWIAKSRLLGARVPASWTIPLPKLPLLTASGALSTNEA